MKTSGTAGLMLLALIALSGCDDDDANEDGGVRDDDAGTHDLDIGVCDPSREGFTLQIDNPYFPLAEGQISKLEGEEDGAAIEVTMTVLDAIEVVAGVQTRVLEEHETEDGEVVEISRNFFTQASDGTVCYYGEEVDEYEDGEIVGHDGAWRAGEDAALPGIVMPADPSLGTAYDQERAEGVAEDHAEITGTDLTFMVPAGTYDDCIRIEETSPLDAGAVSLKVHAPGLGVIFDDGATLTSFSD